jgi:prephenate dehydrogenase
MTDARALETIREFWQEAGSRLHEMSPAAHDSAIARISHLPHAVAAALVHAALSKDPGIAQLAGSGYRDTTRVAAGPEVLWKEIFLENREELLSGISDLQVSLEALKNAVALGDGDAVETFLRAARSLRSQENEPP